MLRCFPFFPTMEAKCTTNFLPVLKEPSMLKVRAIYHLRIKVRWFSKWSVCVNTFFDLIDKYNGKNRNLRDGFRLALRKVIRIGAETYGRASGNEIDKKFISELEARVLRGQITRGEIKEILDMGFVRPDKTQELGKPE